ncbi:MAG: hypothetical protein LHW56_01610 [Candidatus Cloacimonetes bacterium]|nr:hypothetical protein [Candidatus Cloacimonadota bacterium]MDY0171584.1 hypothetical protein [Candidatus Cloacimonadaceae bacterium]
MAMSKEGLSSRIQQALTDAGFNLSGTGKDNTSWLLLLSDALAEAVVDHIQTHARTSSDNESIL